MKHAKPILISFLAVVLLFAVLCMVKIFTVSDVYTEFTVYGDEGFCETKELAESYKGKYLLFLDVNKIKDEIADKTVYKVESVEKVLPSGLKFTFSQRVEAYAVKSDDGYYILDKSFYVLCERDSLENAIDNLTDVLIDVETPDGFTAEVGCNFAVNNGEIADVINTALSAFTNPRDDVESLTVKEMPEKGNYYVYLKMRSGVTVQVRKALEDFSAKLEKGLEKFGELHDADKVCGVIDCYKTVDGAILAEYENNN